MLEKIPTFTKIEYEIHGIVITENVLERDEIWVLEMRQCIDFLSETMGMFRDGEVTPGDNLDCALFAGLLIGRFENMGEGAASKLGACRVGMDSGGASRIHVRTIVGPLWNFETGFETAALKAR
jgi:hypothetical protein